MTELAIYLHWPFCRSKCPYCDFNSHVREAIDTARWRAALLAELDHEAAATAGRTVTSVFFGGGTPSLMPPALVAALLERIAARWRLAPDAEITLEANPSSAETGRLADFRMAGVNRVSLGVQALDDRALAFLGRSHDAAQARAAIAAAARTFERYSFDLIYARPGQEPAAWRAELADAAALAGDHLSVYQLTIERGTRFHALARQGRLALPDEATSAALYETTQEVLENAGFKAYEVSNHARPGGACRHNLAYWRYDDYLGIGPGAHGRATQGGVKRAVRRITSPERWLAAVEKRGEGVRESTVLTTEERLAELVLMGLRLDEGIPADRFLRETGRNPRDALDAARLDELLNAGFLALDADGLRATPAGRRRLDAVIARLLGA